MFLKAIKSNFPINIRGTVDRIDVYNNAIRSNLPININNTHIKIKKRLKVLLKR